MKRNRLIIPAAILVVAVALILSNMDRFGNDPEAAARSGQCTVRVDCGTVLENMELLAEEKQTLIPEDGQLLPPQSVSFAPGESAFDVLQRTLRDEGIHMEFDGSAAARSAYIKGIGNLYELDVGERSGWLYYINREFPTTGVSQYEVQEGDVLEWIYTCDYGDDITLTSLD